MYTKSKLQLILTLKFGKAPLNLLNLVNLNVHSFEETNANVFVHISLEIDVQVINYSSILYAVDTEAFLCKLN